MSTDLSVLEQFDCTGGCCTGLFSTVGSTIATNTTTINLIYSILNVLQYVVISVLMLLTKRKQSIASSITSNRISITLPYIIVSCSLSIIFIIELILLIASPFDNTSASVFKMLVVLLYNLFYLAYPVVLLYIGLRRSLFNSKSILTICFVSLLLIAIQFTIVFLISSLVSGSIDITTCYRCPIFYLGDASPFIDLVYFVVFVVCLFLFRYQRLRRAGRIYIVFHLVLSGLVCIAGFLAFARVEGSLCIMAVTSALRLLIGPWIFYYTSYQDSKGIARGNTYLPEERPLRSSTTSSSGSNGQSVQDAPHIKTKVNKGDKPSAVAKKKRRPKVKTPKRTAKQKVADKKRNQSALKQSLARTPKKKSFFGSLGGSKDVSTEEEKVVRYLLENLEPSVPVVELDDVVKQAKIGVGGFGEVYKGTCKGEVVAIKRVFDLSEAKMNIFLREINVLAQLQHPRITVLVGVVVSVEQSYLLTEFVVQGSLFDLIHKQRVPLDWKRMHVVLQDTAEGMAFLHSCTPPFLHRDLKSQNILIDADWRAKLCDFGMSRAKALAVTMTKLGTLQWVAPEVLREERYSEKADIYSFAILIWEMLARKVPFVGRSAIEVAHNVAYNGLRPNIPGSCPPQLRQLIVRCWDDEPENRGDFQQIYEELTDMDPETW